MWKVILTKGKEKHEGYLSEMKLQLYINFMMSLFPCVVNVLAIESKRVWRFGFPETKYADTYVVSVAWEERRL